MRRVVSFLLVSLWCTVSTVLSDDGLPHYITEKSFDTALRECAQYFLVSDETIAGYYRQGFPETDEIKQLIRCTVLNLDAYDDSTGPLEYVLGNYFKPCPSDTEYAERTRCCVKTALDNICPSDVYSRSYASFMCYYREYGNLVTEDQFVPNTLYELTQMMLFVQSTLNLPYEVLVQFSKGNVVNDPNFPAVLYVWAVRGGYYSLGEGIQLDRLYTQYGVPGLISPETQKCVADVAQANCNADDLTIMYNTFLTCLRPLLPFENLLQTFAVEQLKCSKPCAGGAPAVHVGYRY
ncbi:general odorant-binding protein 69-like [Aedes albopictus]|uniref:Uncharacterized protein n=1 Tax=Aedes albopictus TaxID=7160 RepID=A0ABM1YSE8_AEDAL|nr:general odorant-binding protein 69-like [Aedes albopictus]